MSCGGSSSVGRAPGCGPGGRGFKSHLSPQNFRANVRRAAPGGRSPLLAFPGRAAPRKRGAAGHGGDILLRVSRMRAFSMPAPFCRSVAQSGSAPGLGPGGRRFKSFRSDQFFRSPFSPAKPPPGRLGRMVPARAGPPAPAGVFRSAFPSSPASKKPRRLRRQRHPRLPPRKLCAYPHGKTELSMDGTLFALPGARHSEVMPGTSRAMREAS